MTIRNLHIAMVVRSFSAQGGLELYTHRLVEGLLRHDLRLTVICEEASTTLAHRSLRIVNFPPARPGIRKSQRLEHYYRAASEAVKSHGPFDLVHSQQLPVENAEVVTFHNHTLSRMSAVGTVWENLFNQVKRSIVPAYRLRHHFDRKLCLNARCLVFPSARCRDDFYQTFGAGGLLEDTPPVVAYPGVDPEALAPSPAASSSGANLQRPLTFLFIGRGFRTKGLNVLLEAVRILASRRGDFRLLVAGMRAGPLEHANLRLDGLEKQVSYLGYQEDLDTACRLASVFVMPSRMETFGMSCLQAMRHGLAPIVSRVAGVSELLSDRENALILENHLDAHELSSLMARLMDDRVLLCRLGRAACQLAMRTTWESTVEATLNAYELALGSAKAKAGLRIPG